VSASVRTKVLIDRLQILFNVLKACGDCNIGVRIVYFNEDDRRMAVTLELWIPFGKERLK